MILVPTLRVGMPGLDAPRRRSASERQSCSSRRRASPQCVPSQNVGTSGANLTQIRSVPATFLNPEPCPLPTMPATATLSSADTLDLFKQYVVPNYTRFPV